MKKITILTLTALLALVSCGPANTEDTIEKISIIAPQGTPSMALGNFYVEQKNISYDKFDIVLGSDPLVAAFANQSYDVIIAPTNLGHKFYTQTQSYLLYETIVWGNLYLVTKDPTINDFMDFKNKDITAFGMNSTPYIITQAIESGYKGNVDPDFEWNITFTDDVASANSMLISNTVSSIITAEPSLQTLKKKVPDLKIFDLQELYAAYYGIDRYPQASIFVKKDLKGKIDNKLELLVKSVADTMINPTDSAKNIVQMCEAYSTMGEEMIKAAIPGCNYNIVPSQSALITAYFNLMDSLKLGAQYGDKLPTKEFYYK